MLQYLFILLIIILWKPSSTSVLYWKHFDKEYFANLAPYEPELVFAKR